MNGSVSSDKTRLMNKNSITNEDLNQSNLDKESSHKSSSEEESENEEMQRVNIETNMSVGMQESVEEKENEVEEV